mgnify:CR=1 FL=1
MKIVLFQIDGWVINAITEKNKNVSSQYEISLVFNKTTGLDAFWSNFVFLSSYIPTEIKFMRGSYIPPYPLLITTKGPYSTLEVTDPNTREVIYTSKGFYKKDAKKLYETDEEFHKYFDLAVDYSCRERISKGLLKINTNKIIESEDPFMQEIEQHEEKVVEEQLKKRGWKKKEEDSVFAEANNDEFVNNNQIIEE